MSQKTYWMPSSACASSESTDNLTLPVPARGRVSFSHTVHPGETVPMVIPGRVHGAVSAAGVGREVKYDEKG